MGKRKPNSLRKYKKSSWDRDDIECALREIETTNASVLSVAKKYGMAEGTLRYRLTLKKKGKEFVGSGRHPILTLEEERELAGIISTMSNVGFAPTKDEIRLLVHEYVRLNNLKNPFKNDVPGRTWFKNFLQRQKLSCKKATMLSSARKSATANPFIVYNFYEMIEKIVKEQKLSAAQVWNCDESGFPTDPSKIRAVAPSGKPAWKLTWGAGRENISTLATCNAAGEALPPLVIFAGKNFQSTWYGKNSVPNTMYGHSENGWMTTDVFFTWFVKFCEIVKSRPLLLIYDGHLSHVSVQLIEKAMKEEITIVKLPPHVTDRLQPLDVTCFGPLKREWEKLLCARMNVLGPKETIKKDSFVDLLSTIWFQGLSKENIVSGFRTTGVFPCDKAKYPVSRFDKKLFKHYQAWESLGRPDDFDFEKLPAEPIDLTPSVETTPLTSTSLSILPASSPVSISSSSASVSATPIAPTPIATASASTPLETPLTPTTPGTTETPDLESILSSLGPKPQPVPGFIWVAQWSLQRVIATPAPSARKSFEELALEKIKGPQPEKPKKARKKIDRDSKVITSSEYLESLRALEEEEKQKKEKTKERQEAKKQKKEKQASKKSANKKAKKTEDEEFEEEEDEVLNEKALQDILDEEYANTSSESEVEEDEEEVLLALWKSLSPPVPEEEVVQKWYAVIFSDKKKSYLYIGKALNRFLVDEGGPIKSLIVDCCLKPPVGSTDVLDFLPENQPKDISEFDISDVIAKVEVEPVRGNQIKVFGYDKIKAFYNSVVKLDRANFALFL